MRANGLKHPVMMLIMWALLRSVLLLSTLPALSQGQITLDGSLGPRGPLTGPNYRIDANAGQIRGSNLFHSFGQFNVRPDESATFGGPNTITNIVGRVTGGEQSLIDGRLRSEIAGANLYLLNPSGVMFGPNASLKVSGSFHVSTADFLRFADGAKFFANLGQESVLTVAPPAAFGFLGNNPAAITIRESVLEVLTGKTLSIVGGDIEIVGGPSGFLSAPSGRIQIASVASAGEVGFSPMELAPDLQVDSFARLGRVTLLQDALLDASGNGGGTIFIRAGHLRVDQSTIVADTEGNANGARLGLDLRVTDDAIIAHNSRLFSRPLVGATANGGSIQVNVGKLTLTDDSAISSSSLGTGNGGSIQVNVGKLTLTDDSAISSSSFGTGRGGDLTVTAADGISIIGTGRGGLFSNALSRGDAGRLFISAPNLMIDNGRISARTDSGSRGNAGGAEVRVGQLTLIGGAQIDSSTSGSGRGGKLIVTATESISVGGRDSAGNRSALISNAFGEGGNAGTAGDLVISTPVLMMNGGRIVARTAGDGNAGNIEVRVGRLELTGGAQIFNGTGSLGERSFTGTGGPGRGGKLTVITTDAILIAGRDSEGFQSALSSNAQKGTGNAGDLFISTPRLTMQGGLILASTESASSGHAGNLTLEAGTLVLTDGALISSSTSGSGRGGKLTVTAKESISIAGKDKEGKLSALISNAFGEGGSAGTAGDLVISTPVLMMNGGRILARTAGDGNAGNIEVQVGRLELTGGAQIFNGTGSLEVDNGERIFKGTGGPGQGGKLTVIATDAILIAGRDSEGFQSALSSNAQKGTGNAGDLFISTPRLTMQGGLILASTESASSGHAGNLTLEAGTLVLTDGAQISSHTAGNGQGGNIAIQAQQIDLSKGGTISSRSLAEGNAGNIVIQAGQIFRSRSGAVTTEAEQADGGNIQLTAGPLVELRDSQITATVKSGVGKGGNITIDPQSVVLENSQIRADAFGGPGGNVLIVAGVFLADPTSQVSASSALGIQGTVDIRAPVTALSGALAPLPQAFVSAAALLPARCAARLSGGKYSSLVLGGREGLPLDPGGLLPSPLGLEDWLVADPMVTREPRRQKPSSRFALLDADQKFFPRIQGGNRRDGAPVVLDQGCSK